MRLQDRAASLGVTRVRANSRCYVGLITVTRTHKRAWRGFKDFRVVLYVYIYMYVHVYTYTCTYMYSILYTLVLLIYFLPLPLPLPIIHLYTPSPPTHTRWHTHADPSEVMLVVDGKNDQCSKGEDINFDHVGFSIYGQASYFSCPCCVYVCVCC